MLNVALVALLTAFQPVTPAQPDLKGVACTARELVGTYQLATPAATPGVTKAHKHITPTHFVVVRFGDNDVVLGSHGGTYTLANGTYTETVQHGLGAGWFDKYRGVSVPFQCRLDGDVLHIAGDIQGQKISEQWRRIGGAPAQP
jgi:hypothetical protein